MQLLSGRFHCVFTVSSMQFNNQTTLNIVGDGSGDPVVLNFSSNAQFGGAINLEGGLTTDQVPYNITGGSNLTGGNTLQANSNGAVLERDFLDPNGSISVTHSVVEGRIFWGDSGNMQIVSGDTITAPAVTTPEPSSLLPLGTGLISLLRIGAWRKRLA